MNEHQKRMILATASLLVLMMLYPPYVISAKTGVVQSGYAFLFDMPRVKYLQATVNIPQLAVQIGGALAVGALLVIALKNDK